MQLGADLLHDLRGQVPAGLAVLGFFRGVVAVHGELVAQPGGRAAGPGRAGLPCRGQQLADLTAGQHPGERADRPGRVQPAEPAEERLDVSASQRRRVLTAVGALAQAAGQQRQAGDVVAGLVAAAAAAAAGQVGGRPDLGRLAQPRLGDGGERQAALVPEQGHVPGVLGDLGAGVGHAAACMRHQRVHDAGVSLPAPGRDGQISEGGYLLAARVVADRPEDGVVGLDALPGALLQPEQDLHGDRGAEPGEADLPGARDRRLGQPPGQLIRGAARPAKTAQPLQVGITVDGAAARKLTRAGRHRAGAVAGQCHDIGPAGEGSGADAQTLLLPQMFGAQRLRGFHPRAGASRHDARPVAGSEPAASARRRQRSGIIQAQPGPGQPPTAIQADACLLKAGCLAARRPADRASQQRMIRRQGQHPGLLVPARLGQERRLDPPGQRG